MLSTCILTVSHSSIVLHIIEVECAKRGYKGLVRKLYREFMIMGFISFAILLATETDSFNSSEWYVSFHFAHVVILFIGITFLVQSGALVALIHFRKRTLLSYDNCTSEQLLVEYIDMHEDGGWRQWLFMNGPITISIPELREKMEFKILQEFFIRSYNLPFEFQFATYMCRVLKDYVIALVEVRPISWMSLAALIGINYLRIILIDPIFEARVCEKFPANVEHEGGSSSSHRFLSAVFMFSGTTTDDHSETTLEPGTTEYGHRVCNEYTLRYTFFCEWLIFFYLLGVLIASEIYLSRLIGKVLDREEMIEWIEEEEVAQEEARKRANTLAFDDIRVEEDPDDAPPDAVMATQRPFSAPMLESEKSVKFERRQLPPRPRTSTSSEANGSTDAIANSSGKGSSNGGSSKDPVTAMNESLSNMTPTERIATFRREATKRRSNSYDTGAGIGDGVTGVSSSGKYASLRDRSNSIRRSNSYDPTEVIPAPTTTNPATTMFKPFSPTAVFQAARRENSARDDGAIGIFSKPESSLVAEEQGHGTISTIGNRRNLYFRCMERIMHVELDFHKQEASDVRRGSVTGQEETRAKHATVFTKDMNTHVTPSPNTPLMAAVGRMRSTTFSGPQGALAFGTRGSIGSEPMSPAALGASMYLGGAAGVSGVAGAGNVAGDRSSVQLMSNLNHLQMKDLHRQYKLQQQGGAANGGMDGNTSLYVNANNSPGPSSPNSFYSSNNKSSKHSSLNLSSFYPGARSSTGSANNSPIKPGTTANPKQEFSMTNPARPALESTPSQSVARGAHIPVKTDEAQANMDAMNRRASKRLPIIDPQPEESAKADPPPRLGEIRQRGYSAQFFSLDEEQEIKAQNAQNTQNTDSEKNVNENQSIVSRMHMDEAYQTCLSVSSTIMTIAGKIAVRLFHSIMGYHIVHHHDHGLKPTEDIKELQKDFAAIFLFKNAELYYYCVEMALLVQCLYIALWATNLIVIAKDSYHPVLWEVALVVPLPLNFFILKSIIFTSCTLRSIVTLDQRIASQICEKAEDERNVNMRLRRIVRTALRKLNVPKNSWPAFVGEKFKLHASPSDQFMSQQQFKVFLHSIQVFLTDESLKNLFVVLDGDCDGKLIWYGGLFPIIFPEHVKQTVQIKKSRGHGHGGKSSKRRSSKNSSGSGGEGNSGKNIAREKSSSSKKTKKGSSDKKDDENGQDEDVSEVEGEGGEFCEESEGVITYEYVLPDGTTRPARKRTSVLNSLRDSIVGSTFISMISGSAKSDIGTVLSSVDRDSSSSPSSSVAGSGSIAGGDSFRSMTPSGSLKSSESAVHAFNSEEGIEMKSAPPQRPSLVGKLFPMLSASQAIVEGQEGEEDGSVNSPKNQSSIVEGESTKGKGKGQAKLRFADDVKDEKVTSVGTSTINRHGSKQSIGSSNGSEGDLSILTTSTMGSDDLRGISEDDDELAGEGVAMDEDDDEVEDFDSQESNYSENSYVSDDDDDIDATQHAEDDEGVENRDGSESFKATNHQEIKVGGLKKLITDALSPMSMAVSSTSEPDSSVDRSQLYSPISTSEESKHPTANNADDDDGGVIQVPRQSSYFTRNAKNFVDV